MKFLGRIMIVSAIFILAVGIPVNFLAGNWVFAVLDLIIGIGAIYFGILLTTEKI